MRHDDRGPSDPHLTRTALPPDSAVVVRRARVRAESAPTPRDPGAALRRRLPSLASRPVRRALRSRLTAVAVATAVLVTVATRVEGADDTRRRWGATSTVLVAVRDLPAGTELSADDLSSVEWPRALAPDGALGALPEGRRLNTEVVRGEVLLGHRLADAGAGAWSSLLGDDEAAVQLPLREPAPGVAAGDLVHVVAPVTATTPDAVGQLSVEVVAHDARVLDVHPDTVTVAVRRSELVPTAGAALGGLVSLVVRP